MVRGWEVGGWLLGSLGPPPPPPPEAAAGPGPDLRAALLPPALLRAHSTLLAAASSSSSSSLRSPVLTINGSGGFSSASVGGPDARRVCSDVNRAEEEFVRPQEGRGEEGGESERREERGGQRRGAEEPLQSLKRGVGTGGMRSESRRPLKMKGE
uniref:One cut domain family member 3-like n=1 Tax=Phascolarctos cinereus TaxID=38626 RepID=A0A6P5JXQ8_PHACI|nr:one cut domain family member 3-like [Phascolarctos cinereus]